MVELSPDTEAVLKTLIPDDVDREHVAAKLRSEITCIWEEGDGTPTSLERIRLAVIKLLCESPPERDIDYWIGLAKRDWRDILVWAGFSDDVRKHVKWRRLILSHHKAQMDDPIEISVIPENVVSRRLGVKKVGYGLAFGFIVWLVPILFSIKRLENPVRRFGSAVGIEFRMVRSTFSPKESACLPVIAFGVMTGRLIGERIDELNSGVALACYTDVEGDARLVDFILCDDMDQAIETMDEIVKSRENELHYPKNH